ncbi:MAG: tetratricopeptide repeat protein [Elusimicrobiales bacterium]|nr:tetratricopeptide repeat protein [Elusimicrobiales bacterium]
MSNLLREIKQPKEVYTLRNAIHFFLPLLYVSISSAFYLRTYDSAQVKITLLQMGGITLAVMWFSLIILEGKKAFFKDDFLFLSPFIAYFFYIIFSFINVPYKEWAIDDFVRYLLYSLISLIIIREFDSKAIDRLTKFLIFSAWIAAGYGIIQWIDVTFFPKEKFSQFGFDPFIWRGAFANRIFSTYGNPNFFANYMVLMLPIIIVRFIKTKFLPHLILAAIDIFCIINTYTKGAWIGFGISTLLFVAIYLYYFSNISKNKLKIFFLIIFLVGITIIIGVVKYAFEKSLTSVPFRVATWLSTWEMIETHPLIGSGVGSFRPLYPAYRRPIIFHLEGKHNTETDHAENEHLEQILDNGIIGAGIFYWIIIFVTVTALRAIKVNIEKNDRNNAYNILGYLVSFLGMLIHNFTDVSMRFVSSGVYLGLLPAVIINLSRGHALWEFHYIGEIFQKNDEKKLQTKMMKISIFKKLFSLIGIICLIWISYRVLSEFSQLQGSFFSFNSTGEIILWMVSWGLMLCFVLYVVITFSKVLIYSSNVFVTILILIFYLPLRFSPVYYFWGWFKADVYHNIAIFFSKKADWDNALRYYQKVVYYNPIFIMPYYFMGNVFTDRFNMTKLYMPSWGDKNGIPRNDFERAFEMYEKVRKLAPNYVQMHYQMGTLYFKMGEYFRNNGDLQNAINYYDKALYRFSIYQNLDPVFPYTFFRKAQIYIIKGDFKKAEEEYLNYINAYKCNEHNFLNTQKVFGIKHENPEAYSNLAALYYIMKEYKKSYDMYKKALEINPQFEIAKRNIEIIRNMLKIKE